MIVKSACAVEVWPWPHLMCSKQLNVVGDGLVQAYVKSLTEVTNPNDMLSSTMNTGTTESDWWCLRSPPCYDHSCRIIRHTSGINRVRKFQTNFFWKQVKLRLTLTSRPGEIFWGLNCQTPQWILGQKVDWNKFCAPSGHILPRHKSSKIGHFKANWVRIANFGAPVSL